MVEPISQEQPPVEEKPLEEAQTDLTTPDDIKATTDDSMGEESKQGEKKKKKLKTKQKFFDAAHAKFVDNPFESIEKGIAVKRELFEKGPNAEFAEWKKMMLRKDFNKDDVKMPEKQFLDGKPRAMKD